MQIQNVHKDQKLFTMSLCYSEKGVGSLWIYVFVRACERALVCVSARLCLQLSLLLLLFCFTQCCVLIMLANSKDETEIRANFSKY